uniref:Uncharacterized protein n=1 Tax=Anopheles maculatus TaxID=74869 RepID=A0A182SU70_9DIPT
MSSGSGKKKLVAAAASPLSVSIAANPVASETPTGGFKLLIDKNRIVSVPSTKAQPTVVAPRQQSSVVDYQNVSLSQQTPAYDEYLRIAGGSNAGGTTISFEGVTGAQKILVKKITPQTSGAEIHGIGGEMRVKVTGEDMNRNAQPIASSAGQLKQIKVPATLLGRRMSIHRQLPVATTQELESNNGQQAVTLYTTTVRLSDEQSLLKHKIASNNAFKVPQPALTVATAANTYSVPVTASGNVFVPVSSNALSLPTSCVVNVSSNAANAPINQTQYIVSSKNNMENGKDGSTSVRQTPPPNESGKDQTDSVAVVVTAKQTAQESSAGAVQSAGSTAMGEDGKVQSKQPITTAPATNVSKGLLDEATTTTTIIDTVVLDEETVSKPSREMKSLQITQAKSKILSEFITDTISKGKLRKRRSDSVVDAAAVAVVGTTDADISPTQITQLVIPQRKRNRRRSTVLLMDAVADNGKEVVSDVGQSVSQKMEDSVNESSPPTRVRKIRSVKSEYALQKGDRTVESLSGGAKVFFSNLNLQHEISKTNDQSLSFPGDPSKVAWMGSFLLALQET